MDAQTELTALYGELHGLMGPAAPETVAIFNHVLIELQRELRAGPRVLAVQPLGEQIDSASFRLAVGELLDALMLDD